MGKTKPRGFVTADEIKIEHMPWGPYEWLSRADIVDTDQLLMARVRLRRGCGHDFHRHPNMEELVYILEGKAEQWIGEERRILGPGEVAHVATDVVHATFNLGPGPLRYLMVLGPAKFKGPALVDVSAEEPWCSIRGNYGARASQTRSNPPAGKRAPAKQLARSTSSRKAAHISAGRGESKKKKKKKSKGKR